MLRSVTALLLALAACVPAAQAQFNPLDLGGGDLGFADTPKIYATAIIRGGEIPRLEVTADIEAGWYIYSVTQRAGGPKTTRIELAASNQYELAGSFVAQPKPKIDEEPQIWPGLPIEKHAGKVTWTAPLKLAPGVSAAEVKIEGKLLAQACDPTSCVDQTAVFAAKYTTDASSANPPVEANPPAVQPNRAAAEGVSRFTEQGVTLTGRVTKVSVQPGETFELRVTVAPDAGWHVYALEESDTPEGVSMPGQFVATTAGGLRVGVPQADQRFAEKKLEWPAGAIDRYYQGPVTWAIPIIVPADAAQGIHLVQGVIGYQACADDESGCKQPTGAEFAVDVYVGQAPAKANGQVLFAKLPYRQVREIADKSRALGMQELEPAPPVNGADEADAAVSAVSTDRDEQKRELTVMVALPLAFLGGFILNFMPCVLPVIGLKVMSFVNQAGQDRRRVFTLNMWYVAGLVSVFLALACLAAFLNFGWAEQFQSPEFAIALAAIVFVFALSMLGVWEIPIPGFVGSGKAADMANHEGPSGAFFKGVLTTVLATPCVGPFVVPVVAWAAKQSHAMTFLVFFVMGIGMAAPYIVIGIFPGAVKLLPRPGAWMDTFKHIMGFVLLFTVVFIFAFLDDQWKVPTLSLLFALWAACWWVGRVPLTANLGPKLRAWAGGAAFAAVVGAVSFYGYAFLKGYDKEIWQPFSTQKLAELRTDQTPTLIDFTADWCATCQVNKGLSLYTEATKAFMRKHKVVGLKADKTSDAPEIDQLLAELGNSSGGIPFYAIYPAGGGEPIIMDGLLPQDRLIAALEKAVGDDGASEASTTLSKRDARTAMAGN